MRLTWDTPRYTATVQAPDGPVVCQPAGPTTGPIMIRSRIARLGGTTLATYDICGAGPDGDLGTVQVDMDVNPTPSELPAEEDGDLLPEVPNMTWHRHGVRVPLAVIWSGLVPPTCAEMADLLGLTLAGAEQ